MTRETLTAALLYLPRRAGEALKDAFLYVVSLVINAAIWASSVAARTVSWIVRGD